MTDWRWPHYTAAAWTLLMLFWVIVTARDGYGVVGFSVVAFVAMCGYAFLGVVGYMTRPRRVCPGCGYGARRGETECHHCGRVF